MAKKAKATAAEKATAKEAKAAVLALVSDKKKKKSRYGDIDMAADGHKCPDGDKGRICPECRQCTKCTRFRHSRLCSRR